MISGCTADSSKQNGYAIKAAPGVVPAIDLNTAKIISYFSL